MLSVGVILTFFDDLKTFLPLLAFAVNVPYWTWLNSVSSFWSCIICCFCSAIIPTYCVSTLTFWKRWCNEPICRHSWCWCWCWCWWRCRCGVDSLCFSCPPTIVDEQCKVNLIVGVLNLINEELCSLSLVDTVISDQCANGLPWFEMITCHFFSSDFWYTEEFNMHIFWVI